MRRRSSIYPLLIGWCCAASAVAQPAPQPAPPTSPPPTAPAPAVPAPTEPAPPATEPSPAEPAPAPEGEEAAPPETLPPSGEAPEETAPPALPAPELEVPTPAEMEQKLAEGLPPAPPASGEWTAPSPVFTLHGYLRMRGELMDTFWLGREQVNVVERDMRLGPGEGGFGPDPFTRFRPLERRILFNPEGEQLAQSPCVDEDTLSDGRCDVSTLQFANLRLRLSPQLNLGEDVRVKMTFDVFDNLVAGEVPQSYYGEGRVAQTAFAGTDVPPGAGNNLGDSIKARRAWAEVRNRDLGELRFGRMPQQWGLGMYYNAGDGIDDDLSTDLDRALAITRIAGIYLSASYDFIAEGLLDTSGTDNRPLDASQLDDVDQFTFSAALRDSPEELTSSIERGDVVFNAGVQFTLRNQDAYFVPPDMENDRDPPLAELEATTYTTDLWLLLRYRALRVEAEAVWVTGGMDNILTNMGSYDVNQIGYALETELRLLDDRLGLYIDHGLATGDSDVEGLSSNANYINQLGTENDDTISTFRFHPNYRVDLILWRNIMTQVTGAYYFRPGISYDFIKSDFGQLLGARLDFIYSRASSPVQTWGNDANLGIEIDVSLYFRTEDGPELDDGYHALLQYGVLFPMRGLGYHFEDTNLDTAQTLRLLLGVAF